MRSRWVLTLSVVLSLFCLPGFGGSNRWTITGPDGGTVNKFAFDPGDPSIVYAATDNGVFRSIDGGAHWVAASELLGTSAFDVVVAKSDPQKVFVSTAYGLFKSSDRGLTWKQAHGFASFRVGVSAQNAAVVYSMSTGGPFRSADGGTTFGAVGSGIPSPLDSLSAFYVDPQNDNTVYALFITKGVYKSTDGGANWNPSGSGLPATGIYYAIAGDPTNGSTLYIGTLNGIFKSTNAAGSWTEISTGFASTTYYGLSSNASTVVAATGRGVLKSINGAGWTAAPGMTQSTLTVGVDPLNGANILARTGTALYKSANGGVTFSLASSGLTAFYTTSIAADPRDDAVVYAAGFAGIYKSADRGVTWTAGNPSAASFIGVDPFNSATLYAIFSGVIRKSVDSGATWQDFNTGLPSNGASTIAIDPQQAGVLYTLTGNAPYRKSGNDAWVLRNGGLPPTAQLLFIVADRRNPSTLYTGGTTSGIFKSVDNGATWAPASAGLSGYLTGVAVDPYDSNHLFTWSSSTLFESLNGGTTWSTATGAPSISIVFDANAQGRVYNNASDGTLQRSVDGGKTWSPFSDGFGRFHGTLFVVSASGRSLYAGGSTGGVWNFTNGRRRASAH
jgi:hypothetical protein